MEVEQSDLLFVPVFCLFVCLFALIFFLFTVVKVFLSVVRNNLLRSLFMNDIPGTMVEIAIVLKPDTAFNVSSTLLSFLEKGLWNVLNTFGSIKTTTTTTTTTNQPTKQRKTTL